MNTPQTPPSESAVRRMATRRGYRLTKIRDNSRWFADYGPYILGDERNVMIGSGLDLVEARDLMLG
jgi:hypothetical protein